MKKVFDKKRIAIFTSFVAVFLFGIGLGEISHSSKSLQSSYLGDPSITCTRSCPDGSTIDAEQSCPDYSTSTINNTYCGDGTIQQPNDSWQYEQCDDGNSEDSDICNNQCQWYTNYWIDTTTMNISHTAVDNNTNNGNNTDEDDGCNNRTAQCGSDALNPCETGVSNIENSDNTSWTCTLKNRNGDLCSGSSVTCGQVEPDQSACECSETGRTSVTDNEGNAIVDENGNGITTPVITCTVPVDPATGNSKYAGLNCGLRESTENRAALENVRRQVDGSFGTSL